MTLTNYIRGLIFASRKVRLGIRSSDVVLEVGGGNNPHFRSNIICDKYIETSVHRQGALQSPVPIVAGEIEHLPFKDKAFDFVISNHILEHVDHPDRACHELARVGQRGFIETPSEFDERVSGGKHTHKWYVNREGSKLIFKQKEKPFADEELARMIWEMQAAGNAGLQDFRLKNMRHFFTILKWEGSIDCDVIYIPGGYDGLQDLEDTAVVDDTKYAAKPNFVFWKRVARTFIGHRNMQIDLSLLVACPICKSDLLQQQNTYICQQCQVYYPIKNGIPYLRPGDAHSLSLSHDKGESTTYTASTFQPPLPAIEAEKASYVC